ncbi:MAG: DUF488 domain-containing protein [Trueperaceae bacterium]|nr:DUF488 domain-containing protein [Trueperaceae bacterium]
MTDEMGTLYTIGYQGASPEAFVDRLRTQGVTLLVDVRNAARSRKKGFSKRALTAALQDAGIAYEHWRQLGAPPEMRRALAETGDRAASPSAYAERLEGGSVSSWSRRHATSVVSSPRWRPTPAPWIATGTATATWKLYGPYGFTDVDGSTPD